MKFRALRTFSSTVHGNISAGDLVELSGPIAAQWINAGMVEALPEKPQAREAELSPSSPAGQALSDGRSNTYETKPLSLQPMVPSKPLRPRQSFTDATNSSGTTTQKKSKRRATNAGRKTQQPPNSTD